MNNIEIKTTIVESVSMALVQNSVPVIQYIEIINNGETDIENHLLKINSDPLEAFNTELPIDLIRSGEALFLEKIKLKHSWDFYNNISEKIAGSLTCKLEKDSEIIAEVSKDITFYTQNTWLGQGAQVELICSHIQPNCDGVQNILKEASSILQKQTGSSALDAYQSKSKSRVYEISQAIFTAIREQNISYAEPPAGFEQSGQKIREVNDILKFKLSTCLDSALLYAACLEQSGLNPLIFLKKGHAFVGLWLEDKNLPRVFDEDPQFFRKRIELNEILSFEATFLTSDTRVDFKTVEENAKNHFRDEESFNLGIDVKYCRNSLGINPLGEKSEYDFRVQDNDSTRNEDNSFVQKEFKSVDLSKEAKARKGELEKWQDKLLDLTFRNRLLNFKNTKGTVQVQCNNIYEIEDNLADGSVYELLPESEEGEIESSRSDRVEIQRNRIDEGFSKRKLYTNLSTAKFKSNLSSIYRSIRNAIEETGVNTLFLTLGVLNWTEEESSKVVRQSPILLLPIELNKKHGQRFTIFLRDDDTIFNHTLSQKLQRDFNMHFPGLDPLPEDESGVDVEKVLNIVREVIKDKRGWEVTEDIWISEFSFQKYLMWKELNEHYEDMLLSPVVKRIMDSTELLGDIPFISEDNVEEYLAPNRIFCPLSADSSQLAAIFSAFEGKSFVLQGPPGTGKSQTIANMISHCLSHGKKVLFVSEKKVALDVVYKRLKDIGLGPLCLELHSKKSEKKAVAKSFMEALEFKKNITQSQWDTISNDVKESMDELNRYFEALHDESNGKISAYKAFLKSTRSEFSKRIEINTPDIYNYDAEKIHYIRNQLVQWVNSTNEFSNEVFNAWKYCKFSEWSISSEDDLKEISTSLINNLKSKPELLDSNNKKFKVSKNWTFNEWNNYKNLLELIIQNSFIESGFIDSQLWSQDRTKLEEGMNQITNYLDLKNSLEELCDLKILEQNNVKIEELYNKSIEGFIVVKLLSSSQLKKLIKPFIKVTKREKDIAELIIEIKSREKEYNNQLDLFNKYFIFEFEAENYESYLSDLTNADSVRKCINNLYGEVFELIAESKSLYKNLMDNRDLIYEKSSNIKSTFREIITSINNQLTSQQRLVNDFKFNEKLYTLTDEALINFQQIINSNIFDFRDLCSLNKIEKEIINEGFGNLFTLLFEDEISKENLIYIFEFNFYNKWLEKRFQEAPILAENSGKQLNSSNDKFKTRYNRYQNATKKALLAASTKDKPVDNENILPKSPLGFIKAEGKKTRKIAPIRKYLTNIKSVSSSLKPCYLMSPLSVSQYLEVAPQFDIVIFDEASQIQPWDAIGSMARGNQVIVVGDSKQLPPTSFFSNSGENDDDEKIDSESVLEMFGTMFPELLLRWHYRSRSESLIAFSNHHIYRNRLHTFPSSDTNDSKVGLNVISDSFYDRGKSKTNRKEAEAVVKEIFRRLKDNSSTNSIGVVTFSSTQANMIEDLIEDQLLKSSEFEQFFNPNSDEYVFVKNLESVQGDERDVILFSIGYGKDRNGIINKNFGPLNNSGGERRLNVAVTRAREEVQIYSNFRAREFDTSTSKSEGLSLLKEYMAYAEEGHESLFKRQQFDDQDDFESPFEEEVATSLRAKGWSVKTQIGVGGYRVDLGIVHPDNPGQFLAGLECDGARYHSAKSARDRDILRQSVLEGLGWNILRIWSTDWWHDKNRVIDRVIDDINQLLESEDKKTESESEPEENSDDDLFTESDLPEEKNYYDPSKISLYKSGEFFESERLITSQLSHIVDTLSPISRTECFSYIRDAWGFKKTGKRMQEHLERCSRSLYKTKAGDEHFYWLTQEQTQKEIPLRYPHTDSQRHPKTIAPHELMSGFYELIKENKEVDKKELYRALNKKLGYASIAKETEKHMELAIDLLEKRSLVRKSEGEIVIL
jgi:superfamily I DNA and/or RNA helicase